MATEPNDHMDSDAGPTPEFLNGDRVSFIKTLMSPEQFGEVIEVALPSGSELFVYTIKLDDGSKVETDNTPRRGTLTPENNHLGSAYSG